MLYCQVRLTSSDHSSPVIGLLGRRILRGDHGGPIRVPNAREPRATNLPVSWLSNSRMAHMRLDLQSLVRHVMLSSTAALMSATTAKATVPEDPALTPDPENSVAEAGKVTSVRRGAKPRLVLKHASDALYKLYDSHRSHRSHSSHRSHYSSYVPSQPPPQAAPRQRADSPAVSSSVLGSRSLRRGMLGQDVSELMLLLVKRGFLSTEQINTSGEFTAAVENAVRTFQTSIGLRATGVADPATIVRLKTGQ